MTEIGPNIAKALVEFQAEVPTVAKKQKAVVGTYSYTYAGLPEVSAAALPLLSKHGLGFVATPVRKPEGYMLVGILLHESGESIEGEYPIQGSQPQQIGSSITYGRRYLLGTMTGIVTDDDDDGHLAQQATQRAERLPATPADDQWYTAPPVAPEDPTPLTTKTNAHMHVLFGRKGVTEEEQLPGVNHILGTAYESRKQITEAQAKRVIAVLNKRPDVDAPLPEGETS